MGDTFKYLRYRLRHALPKGNLPKLFVVVILVLVLPVGVLLLQGVQRYKAGATFDTTSIYFAPAQQTLPPDSNFKVMMDAKTNQIGFVRIEFSLDTSKVNLSSEIMLTQRLATVIQKSPMSEVNTTGRGVIVAGLSPLDRSNALTGITELANFNIKALDSVPNREATVSITDTGVQLISMESQALPFTTQQASLILNPTAQTSTVAPTQIATGSSSPNATNTISPTGTSASKPGDANGDGLVNITDVGILVSAYGTKPISDIRADLNKDGVVNIIDIGIVIDNYGQ